MSPSGTAIANWEVTYNCVSTNREKHTVSGRSEISFCGGVVREEDILWMGFPGRSQKPSWSWLLFANTETKRGAAIPRFAHSTASPLITNKKKGWPEHRTKLKRLVQFAMPRSNFVYFSSSENATKRV